MRPYAAVPPLLCHGETGVHFAGSCFSLAGSPQHFITAHHCVAGCKPEAIFILDSTRDRHNLRVDRILQHPEADLAILTVSEPVPEAFEQLELDECDFRFGAPAHSFGMVLEHGPRQRPVHRVVGGIIQRDMVYESGSYRSPAVELSYPIPNGMSGGPAFYPLGRIRVFGVAIGTIESEVVVHAFEEREDGVVKERERVSRIVQYGVALRLHPLRDWIAKSLCC